MIEILSVENMRKSDENTIKNGVPGRELMARAAKGIFNAINTHPGLNSPVAIVCGSGNNAGDGYALALLLKEANITSHIILTSERFSEDGKYYFDLCVKEKIEIFTNALNIDYSVYKIIVDCIYGTGFHGTVNEPVATVINKINASGAYVVSVDINSGLNGDNGMTELCVESDLTVSIGSFKPGHFLNMAKDVIKEKVNCPIGIEPIEAPYELLEKEDVKKLFPKRKNFSNKGTYGYITLIGGSLKYNGAIKLASMAEAAMRSGAGVATIALPSKLVDYVAPVILESTLYPLSDKNGELLFNESELSEATKNRKAVAFGMGIGISVEVEKALAYLLKSYTGTLIVDADGLTCLSKIDPEIITNSTPNLVLTPHIKEFSRLCSKSIQEIQEAPVKYAKEYAGSHNLTLLLKGPSTIITDGSRVILSDTGCPGMATAGSGDVLSGITAAICGSNPQNTIEAVASAAWINGRAGEMAEKEMGNVSMTAGDTVKNIIIAINNLSAC